MQQIYQCVRHQWPAEIKPLAFATTLRLQKSQLFLGFHTFCYDVLIETFPHADDSRHNRGIIGIGRFMGDFTQK